MFELETKLVLNNYKFTVFIGRNVIYDFLLWQLLLNGSNYTSQFIEIALVTVQMKGVGFQRTYTSTKIILLFQDTKLNI